MMSSLRIKTAVLTFICFELVCFSVRALDVNVYVSRPPNCIKFVSPEYPPSLAVSGVGGKGVFLLKVNTRTGEVDEVKVLQSCGYRSLNELAAKALLQWSFQPGTTTQLKVPVQFLTSGYSRSLH